CRMTTDITELAQSLKAAAEKATPGPWRRSSVRFNGITDIANPMEQGSKPHVANASEKRDAEFIALANPSNILALVEALEKAQQYAKERDAENQDLMLTVGRLRVEREELESRTVKLPDDKDGQAYGFGKWANGKLPATAGTMTIAYCEDAWRAAFEVFSSAAGIKVEAE
ncbi:ead/Ea22-like family protein, partial [Klebsiella pneumoniae]|uniref:ead/Ea22-like family protein n=3 Tax=Klebsiella pneumoniae TaxID=573 RepID=UPI002B1BE54B